MKTLVVGANGKIGQKTVQELLAAGHEVTAFGRSVERIPQADGLRLVKGDATDGVALSKAVTAQDAVILTFGAPLNRTTILSGTDLCEVATKAVVAAMKDQGVGRLVAMTSIGAGDSRGRGRWIFRNVIEPVMLRRIMRDRTAQEQVVRSANLPEWVIVRPAELTDGAKVTAPRVFDERSHADQPTTVSRATVGAFLTRCVDDHDFDGQAVIISDGDT